MSKYSFALIAILSLTLGGGSQAEGEEGQFNGDLVNPGGRRVIASYYGAGQKLAKHTANGEVFNPNAMTAAMRTCPFGTRVRVTNPKNGKSVTVRINDRGPAKWTGATIDLTRAAARKIGISKGPVIIDKC